MKNKHKKIEDFFKEIKEANGNSPDITNRIIEIGNKRIGYIFIQSVSSDDKISDFLVRSLSYDVKNTTLNFFSNLVENLKNSVYNSNTKVLNMDEDLFYYLSSGFTILVFDNEDKVIVVETRMILDRGVVEASSEKVIRGPKDSFTENHMINMGLIRKRIKDPNLWFKESIVGKRTKTKVNIVYLQDVVEKDKIEKIQNRISEINIDGVLDSGYLRDFIVEKKTLFFPKVISTERPDMVCSSILEGKIVILVENSPFALIIPGMFVDFFHTSEDNYQLPFNAAIARWIRFISFIITIITPAFYIAISTYDVQLIPSKLLTSLASQRQGVPFPTSVEVLLLLIVFEILRECDLRTPSQMGASVSIVGALVLGDAAVAAGIVSPIAVIIVAVTSISGLLFSDIDVVNSIRVWLTMFLILSSIMGFIGIVASSMILITRLASIETLGTPFLAPLSPFNLKAQKYGLFKTNRSKMKERPFYLYVKNKFRKGDKNA